MCLDVPCLLGIFLALQFVLFELSSLLDNVPSMPFAPVCLILVLWYWLHCCVGCLLIVATNVFNNHRGMKRDILVHRRRWILLVLSLGATTCMLQQRQVRQRHP